MHPPRASVLNLRIPVIHSWMLYTPEFHFCHAMVLCLSVTYIGGVCSSSSGQRQVAANEIKYTCVVYISAVYISRSLDYQVV